MIRLGFVVLLVGISSVAFAQSLRGRITDENGKPLAGAAVVLDNGLMAALSDREGAFSFSALQYRDYTITVQFLGYTTFQQVVNVKDVTPVDVALVPSVEMLGEVVVKDGLKEQSQRGNPLSIEQVNRAYLMKNQSGSLMQTLERLPGVGLMSIGSGQSKPTIRGLGFNRVVVVENGTKHEGQQWGADHGLEIDQFAVERALIIKGPASLMYGSDAIGGVIELSSDRMPCVHSIDGDVHLTTRTNNNLYGTSVGLAGRSDQLYVKFRASLTDYADYKIPADSVAIYSYKVPLRNNRLRNTAGEEQSLHLTLGYVNDSIHNKLNVSHTMQQSGFFANAHGREPRNVDTQLHDASNRDVLDPSQKVTHLNVVNQTTINLNKVRIETELGVQRNYRQEFSQYVNHGYMPSNYPYPNGIPQDLERLFDKYTYTAQGRLSTTIKGIHQLSAGVQYEQQDNAIDGWSFIIPAFGQTQAGIYLYDKISLSPSLMLHAGIRYDQNEIDIQSYHDWFQTPALSSAGDTLSLDYLQRSPRFRGTYSNATWSIGVNYHTEQWTLKGNIGKSFRMPIAKELAANGVNYHHFSYEKGDTTINAEIAYQADVSAEINQERWAIQVSPFMTYFPNYIYLNPSYLHDYKYGAGNQVFNYTQGEVLRYGGEFQSHYQAGLFTVGLTSEWVVSQQLSGDKKGFTLPFSPPLSGIINLTCNAKDGKFFRNGYLSVDLRLTAAQNSIVPPEQKTPGYHLLNLSAGLQKRIGHQWLGLNLQVVNVMNKNYLDHTSFYRLISLPEAGRNFVVSVNVPFQISQEFEEERRR